jgi:DNA-directed RNA polymerase specialized sigma24 family protein
MLTYMSSGNYREVVERFGITDANARKRIQQARAILRERLGDYRGGRTPRRRS